MNWLKVKSALIAVMMAGMALGAAAPAAAPSDDATCLACHGQKTEARKGAKAPKAPPFVDAARFATSVHAGNGCTSCHADVDLSAHPGKPVGPVVCATCHDKPSATYEASVHGLARKKGDTGAAQCSDCHGMHDIIKVNDPLSPVNRDNLGKTCGQCHPEEVDTVRASIHGQAMANGVREAPSCVDCHSDHQIESLKSASPTRRFPPRSAAAATAIARMNAKFDLPNNRVPTFFDSYHGMAAKMGSKTAANCASCHGYHNVLPASDPKSSVNKANLIATCQKCHANANEKFALGTIHEDKNADLRPGRQGRPLGAHHLHPDDHRGDRRHGRAQPADPAQEGHGLAEGSRTAPGAHDPGRPDPARPAGLQLHRPGDQRLRAEVPRFRPELADGLQRAGPPHRPPRRRLRHDRRRHRPPVLRDLHAARGASSCWTCCPSPRTSRTCWSPCATT